MMPFSAKTQPPRRLKRFVVTAKQLAELLEGGVRTHEVRGGMPAKAVIKRCDYKTDTDVFEMWAEHQDFDPIAEGGTPPEQEISVLPARAPEPELKPIKWREWT